MFTEFLQKQGLSVERLHALIQLSEEGSLIRAAGGDSGRQSRYSHYLRELSAFFGTALTEKVGKTLRLTPAGQELARLAQEHLRALQNFQRSVKPAMRQWSLGAGDSLLQWLVIPALGTIRHPALAERFVITNLRTDDIAARVQDQRLDFGLLRSNAVPDKHAVQEICVIRYGIYVPRRLHQGRVSVKNTLLGYPHAAVAGDGQLTQHLEKMGTQLGGVFRAELLCDSLGQCLAAVRTGAYAAVLPAHAVEPALAAECVVVDDDLEKLNRTISLIWNRRTLDVLGTPAERIRNVLRDALRDEAAQRGIGIRRDKPA